MKDKQSMPDDDYEALLDGFIASLNEARRKAGSPSYTEIEQTSRRLRARHGVFRVDLLARSTTQEILNGRRKQPPKWHWVASYVTVLRAMAGANKSAADSIGTVDEWKRKHDVVHVAHELAARQPVSIGRHRKQGGRDNLAGVGTSPDMVPPPRPDAEDAWQSRVLQMIRQAGAPQWWHGYCDVTPEWLWFYLYLESVAKVVRAYEPEFVPGLLQTEAYARAVLTRCHPDASGSEITRLVELRMRRQERLQDQRFQLWVIMGGAALEARQVDAQTMRSQITQLINISEQPNVTLQALHPEPSRPDDHVTIKEPITIFRSPEEHLGDVVFLERPRSGVFVTDRKGITHYNQLMSRLGMRAASAQDTRSLLREIYRKL
jgi:Domain of unknown function (DUF5753)